MAKNTIKIESKTLEQIMQELEIAVTTYNTAEKLNERTKAREDADKLCADYNEAAKHSVYADCLATEEPMLTFIKKYEYEVIKVSLDTKTALLTIKTEGAKGKKFTELLNLWDFDKYCKSLNRQVTAALDWDSKSDAAKEVLIENLGKYVENGHEMHVGKLQEALQEVFDSIIMIAAPSGKNAVRIASKQVRTIYTTSGKEDFKKLQVMYGREDNWQKKVLGYLHVAVAGKDFVRIYGEPKDAKATATEETAENTEETTAK